MTLHKIQKYRVRLEKAGVLRVAEPVISCELDARECFFKLLADLPHEELHALFVNGRGQITGTAVVSMGGQHASAVTVKDLFRAAIAHNAAALVLGHNHPSGDPTPSTDDLSLTACAIDAGKLIGIEVLDHIVVCPESRRSRSIIPLVR